MGRKEEKVEGLDLSILDDGFGLFEDQGSVPISVVESIDDIEDKEEDDEKGEGDKSADEKVENEPKFEQSEEEFSAEGNDGDDDKVSPIKIFAELLDEHGVVDFNPESFEDSEEYLVSLVSDKVSKEVNRYKESLPEKIKDIIDAYEDGTPLGEYLDVVAQIDDFESLKEDDIRDDMSLQKDLVRELLKHKGFSSEQIDRKLSRFIDSGLLEDEALDAQADLVKIKKAEKEQMVVQAREAEQARINKQKEFLTSLKTKIDTVEEVVPGFKLSKKQRELLYDGITRVDKTGKSELQKKIEKDPDFHLKTAYLALVLDWDFSAFEAKAATKASQKLKGSLDNEPSLRRSTRGGVDIGGNSGKVDFEVLKKAIKQI